MTIKVLFEITINEDLREGLVSRINNMEFELPYSIGDPNASIESNKIVCFSLIPEIDAFYTLIGKLSSLYQLDGVQAIKILHVPRNSIVDKKPSHKPYFKYLIASAFATFLSGFGIVWGLDSVYTLNLELETYAQILVIPTAVSFMTSWLLLSQYRN
jgi:hypothetical protein